MEDATSMNQNGGQMGSQGASAANNKQNEEAQQKNRYSIPGILHFIQHEWARFELERSQWEVDRAELQVSFYCLSINRFDLINFHLTYCKKKTFPNITYKASFP